MSASAEGVEIGVGRCVSLSQRDCDLGALP